jgi:uncharacterized Zn-finger protein
MLSILNNDENPAFAVRKQTNAVSSGSFYKSLRPKSESTVLQPTRKASTIQGPSHPTSTLACNYFMASLWLYNGHSQHHRSQIDFSSQRYRTLFREAHSGLSGLSLPSQSTTHPDLRSSLRLQLNTTKSTRHQYICPYATSHACTTRFTTSSHAARHGRTHTGIRSFQCPACNRMFSRRDNMKSHYRTHRAKCVETDKPVSDLNS